MHAGHVSTAGTEAHSSHLDGVNARGEVVMGFSQQKSEHHFHLTASGGSIAVAALDPLDLETRDQIRRHLQALGPRFASGDFTQPEAIHHRTPPGTGVMAELAGEIDYRYEESEHGARLVIESANRAARAAIHDFLRFQIEDHQTGDPLTSEPLTPEPR
jgi:hypothetical protein